MNAGELGKEIVEVDVVQFVVDRVHNVVELFESGFLSEWLWEDDVLLLEVFIVPIVCSYVVRGFLGIETDHPEQKGQIPLDGLDLLCCNQLHQVADHQ